MSASEFKLRLEPDQVFRKDHEDFFPFHHTEVVASVSSTDQPDSMLPTSTNYWRKWNLSFAESLKFVVLRSFPLSLCALRHEDLQSQIGYR